MPYQEIIAAMGLLNKIFRNARKPEGLIGRLMVSGMNGSAHAALAKWGLQFIHIPSCAHVLDIGCGGGGNIARMLKVCPEGHVTGIDYSPVSVAKSTSFNKKAIGDGRARVLEGNVARLPFEENAFDVVTAFETIYFWPSIEDSFREVLRVLKPGGQFMIVNEADGIGGDNKKWEKIVGGMHTYTAQEQELHLTNVGFVQVEIHHDAEKHRLCVIASKN